MVLRSTTQWVAAASAAMMLTFSPAQAQTNKAGKDAKAATQVQQKKDQDEAQPVKGDTRLVVFNYDANLVYNILTQDGMMTHIELAPGETIQGFYLSDSTRWKHLVSKDKSRVFIKPSMPHIDNSATMVTTSRVYELRFRSGATGEPWYQRVRWAGVDIEFPGAGVFEGVSEFAKNPPIERGALPAMRFESAAEFSTSRAHPAGSVPVQAEKLNFAYTIEGDASFRPHMVFDDGTFTWIQMGDGPTLPALFMVNEKGGLEIVNYTVHGRFLKISQLVPGVVLRLDDKEVRIGRKKQCSGWWC